MLLLLLFLLFVVIVIAIVGIGVLVENDLANTLMVVWDETLVVLFGSIQSTNVAKQLETAEKWSYVHPENAVLLGVMGKLAIKCGDTFKAESYLAKSIAAEPTVEAYQLLGDLLFAQGDKFTPAFAIGGLVIKITTVSTT